MKTNAKKNRRGSDEAKRYRRGEWVRRAIKKKRKHWGRRGNLGVERTDNGVWGETEVGKKKSGGITTAKKKKKGDWGIGSAWQRKGRGRARYKKRQKEEETVINLAKTRRREKKRFNHALSGGRGRRPLCLPKKQGNDGNNTVPVGKRRANHKGKKAGGTT